MDKLRDAIATLRKLLKSPWGYGSPIPLRPKHDDHSLAAVGRDDEAEKWAKAHAP